MKYVFDYKGQNYTLLNLWFSDVSVILLCDDKEIYRLKRDYKTIVTKEVFIVEADDIKLTVEAISRIFNVDFKIFDEEKNSITLKKSKLNLLKFIKGFDVSLDLSFDSKLSLVGFVMELFGVCVAIWLLMTGDIIEGVILLILSVIGLLNITPKNTLY